MTISIKHAKTNAITDWTQPQLDTIIAGGAAPLPPVGTTLSQVVLPSDWNANLTTSMASGFLLGRSTAGAGSFEELTVGSGLSLSGGTLSATGGGTGTVTSVSVTTANGVSGTVATATTTPAISLTLGAITPTSVAASGTVTGSNLSGTNTGDQTITLTGAVTGSGTGSFATTIATPGTLTVSSTNSTATAHTHAVTSSSAPGAAASILATDATGHIGSTGTRIVKGWFTDLQVTNAIAGSVTGNAATVTTNANLTGPITSTGNATAVASQTGTGTTFVMNTSPTLVTPNIGTPSAGVLTNCTGTATGLTSGITNALKSATTTVDVSAATAPTNGQALVATSSTTATWQTLSGTGTVTSVSVVSANGFAGSVATSTTTPAITLSTSITGVLKGNGTAISAATAGTDYVAPATKTAFTAQQNFSTATLTDAANISWNLDSAQVAKVTLGGNRTLDNPTNLVDGGTYILRVIQDGTGSRTLAYGTAYKWPAATAPVLSTGAGAIDILTFVSDGANMYGVAQKAFG